MRFDMVNTNSTGNQLNVCMYVCLCLCAYTVNIVACIVDCGWKKRKTDYAINIYKQTTYQHTVCHNAKLIQNFKRYFASSICIHKHRTHLQE